MDTATSRSMTVLVGQGRLCPPASFSRHSRSTRRTETPSFPKYLPNRNAVIPEVPAEPKRRHSCSNRRTQTPSFRAVPAAPKLRHSARSRGIHLCLPTYQPEKPVPSALQYGYCDFAQYDGVGRARASLSSGILLPSFPKYPPNRNAVIPEVPAEPKRRHSCSNLPNPNTVIPRSARRTQTPSFRAVPAAPKLGHSARSRGIHLCLPTL